MYTVSKLYKGQLGAERLGQVIDLATVTQSCPLCPNMIGTANITVSPSNSLAFYDHFYINSFASHGDYRCLV